MPCYDDHVRRFSANAELSCPNSASSIFSERNETRRVSPLNASYMAGSIRLWLFYRLGDILRAILPDVWTSRIWVPWTVNCCNNESLTNNYKKIKTLLCH